MRHMGGMENVLAIRLSAYYDLFVQIIERLKL